MKLENVLATQMSNFTILTIYQTLTYLLKHFKKILDDDNQETKENNNDNNCNIFGEKKKFDKLSVMDDISGLADKSNYFSNF